MPSLSVVGVASRVTFTETVQEARDGGVPLLEVRKGRDGSEGLLRPSDEEGVTD